MERNRLKKRLAMLAISVALIVSYVIPTYAGNEEKLADVNEQVTAEQSAETEAPSAVGKENSVVTEEEPQTKAVTVSITYDPNGGDMLFTVEDVCHVIVDKGDAFLVADCKEDDLGGNNAAFVKDGYKFVGWNTKADGTGTAYEPSMDDINKAAIANDNMTLYAQWEKVKEKITITYDPNGGDMLFTVEDVCHVIVDKGDAFLVADCKEDDLGGNNAAFVKDGYKFVGWNTKADGTGTAYEPSMDDINKAAIANDNMTLYAQWEKIEESTDGDKHDDEDKPVDDVEDKPVDDVEDKPVDDVEDKPIVIENQQNEDTPKTGDESGLMAWTFLVVVAGLGTLVISKKQIEAKKE